LRRAGL